LTSKIIVVEEIVAVMNKKSQISVPILIIRMKRSVLFLNTETFYKSYSAALTLEVAVVTCPELYYCFVDCEKDRFGLSAVAGVSSCSNVVDIRESIPEPDFIKRKADPGVDSGTPSMF
jgi:hypothetical protein